MGSIARWALDKAIVTTKKLAENGEMNIVIVPKPVEPYLFNIDEHGAILTGETRENGFNFLDTDSGTAIFPLEQATLAAPATYYRHT